MRYDGCLLTEAESRSLIDEVDRWCHRTGTNYNKLVVAAGVGATTRHKVRIKGQRITMAVAAKLRQAMRQNRNGISREDYRAIPKPWRREVPLVIVRPEPMRVSHETCRRCGARSGRCEHTLSAHGARGIVAA
jgi:hypothetical protein